MPYIDSIGAKLYFEETGEGHPIVFLHELGSDCREWETQVRYFSRAYRCITFNARGYPPSDVPEGSALYGWQIAVDDIDALMRGLAVERAHLIGLSMGGYAALQFGLQYPERVSAIVAAGVGSGSAPSQRDAWLRETSVLARAFVDRGMDTMARKIAHGQTRVQLKYKDARSWQEFLHQLRHQSSRGISNTMTRCQALRPPLHDLSDQLALMRLPVLLALGDEDLPCLETNLMLKTVLPNAGLWICPNTGHTINLEEPTAFNIQVDSFLAAVERRSWRRGYPAVETHSNLRIETARDRSANADAAH